MYSSALSATQIRGQDIKITINELELEDDLIGLFDSMKHVDYLSMIPAMLYNKPQIGAQKDFI